MSDESELGQGCTDAAIDQAIGMRTRTVKRLRQKVHEIGVLPALERSPRLTPANPPKITGELEAHITRIACSQCPEGAARWTLQLIADEIHPDAKKIVLVMDNLNTSKHGIEEAEQRLVANNPMRRLGEVDEVVQAMLWASSSENSFYNGQTLSIDGGLRAF